MHIRFLTPIALAAASLSFAALAGEKAAAPAAPAATKASVTAAADVKWALFNPADPKGPSVSIVTGDMKGPTTFLLKVPAGGKAGTHLHNSDYYAVVVQGAPAHGDTEATAKKLSPGATWFEQGKHSHFDMCTSKEDCILALTFLGPVDMLPTGPDGKPLPAPAAPAPAKK